MVKINVQEYFELPTKGSKVALFEMESFRLKLLGHKYQVATHRDVLPAAFDGVTGEIPVGSSQKGFRDPDEAKDYFEFCCWKLGGRPVVTTQ